VVFAAEAAEDRVTCLPRYDDLDRLEVLTVITGRLVNETPLRVGVGKEELEERQPLLGSAVDIAPITIRFADGRSVPYIPGSSMKGVLRSLAEAMVRAQGKDDVHSPWDFGEKGKIEEEAESGNYCIICGTFGSTKLASHVRVYDAYPETDIPESSTRSSRWSLTSGGLSGWTSSTSASSPSRRTREGSFSGV